MGPKKPCLQCAFLDSLDPIHRNMVQSGHRSESLDERRSLRLSSKESSKEDSSSRFYSLDPLLRACFLATKDAGGSSVFTTRDAVDLVEAMVRCTPSQLVCVGDLHLHLHRPVWPSLQAWVFGLQCMHNRQD